MRDQSPGAAIAHVQLVGTRPDDDRLASIGREIEVVGIGQCDRADHARGPRVDFAEGVGGFVVNPQAAHVPIRRHLLGGAADAELGDDTEAGGVDHVNLAGERGGHVDTLGVTRHARREPPAQRVEVRLRQRARLPDRGGGLVRRRGCGDAPNQGAGGRRAPAAGRQRQASGSGAA